MSALPPPLLIALAVTAPLLAAALLVWPAARSIVRRLAPLTALPALILALTGGEAVLPLPWLLLGGELRLDANGRLFLLFTAWLWLIAAWFAAGYLASDRRGHYFLLFFLLAQAGNFGLILAGDLISFNLFFTLMGLAAYGLVIHRRRPSDLAAGRVYLTLVIIGEVLIFLGLLGVIFTTDGLINLPAAMAGGPPPGSFTFFFLLGFGVKAGMLPVHFWLPLAHPAAPVPASAVLSGAMIKAGLLGWLRFLAPPPPAAAEQATVGGPALPEWGLLCLLLGVAAAFYGAVMGMTRQEPKSVLAWSSISQMGLITAALGLGLSVPELFPRAIETIKLYALHHGLAKGALFLAVALAAYKTNGKLLTLGLLLPALALVGAPLTSGYFAKEQLLALGGAGTVVDPALWEWLLKLSGLATTLLLLRFLALMRQQWRQHNQTDAADTAAAPRTMLLPWGLLVLSGLPLGWYLYLPTASTLLPALGPLLTPGKLTGALLPLLAALALARPLERRWPTRLDTNPRESAPLTLLATTWQAGATFSARAVGKLDQLLQRLWHAITTIWQNPAQRWEKQLTAWPVAGCCSVLLILMLFYLIW
ncbi:complex I subunit 5 family protein [Desulfurivibrio alkaliphilus]|uniref:NADH/Ubiquinone/plastoquinone (Complex I) n=1 Tax=Desulfurivibrio alkaliphilus (strain DSM 19089 / UNIQEM U267 / AHT2) TaxID=589865 RepID=D6Z733_DESAT|nr:complex I subunit 5 family protein [Desulfurivibrio alkaliphilus]ADH87020.1 NADH/Ubiquinone/plastoquinone (complex I) [Desulfurivibrio alkaliphilus AHT 2]